MGGGGRCTGAAVVARHGAILSTANAWEVIWARPGARDGQPIAPGRPYRRPRPWMKFVCRFLNTARLVGAVSEAPDHVANAERDGGGRIGALLDCGAQVIASLVVSVADRLRYLSGSITRPNF